MANWSEKALAEWANKNLDYLVTSRPTGVNLKIECASLKGEKKKSPFLSAGHLYLYNLDSVITFWMSGNVGHCQLISVDAGQCQLISINVS